MATGTVIVIATVIVLRPYNYVQAIVANHTARPTESAAPTVRSVDTAQMSAGINKVIADNPQIDISVAVINLNTGTALNYGDDSGYLGASTAKLITASLYLHEVEAGTDSLQTTISGHTAQYELQQLIENSDNDAWLAFNDKLGHTALQSWADQSGLSSYDADTNILTARDMASLLQKLYQRKLLNESHTKLLLSYMAQASRTDLIDSAVPADVTFYHKAGWLDDRIHDAAIIDDGKTPYVLVIFSKTQGTYDTAAGQKLFQAITAYTVQAYISLSE